MAAFRGRIEILPEKINNFSVIAITFHTYEKIIIFPGTKKLILQDGIELNDVETEIIECRIGKKLIIELDARERFESELDVFKIKVRK